jgi:hypothetical protein
MKEFICEFPNSIPDMLCEDIINMYEIEQDRIYEGIVHSGLRKEIKDTTDLGINKQDDKWLKIEKFLYNELGRCYKEYVKKINKEFSFDDSVFENTNNSYKMLDDNCFVHSFMIQKYNKGVGKYIYHDDFTVDYSENSYRTVTFLWYLNTIEHGGTTDFLNGKVQIKPERGKLVLFPASWCFPHCGRTPLSDDKYIITNWFYEKFSDPIQSVKKNSIF